MYDLNIIDIMHLVTAVDDKVWHLQSELDSADPDDSMAGYLEEEQARYMTLAAKLKQIYLHESANDHDPQAYETLIRGGVPGR